MDYCINTNIHNKFELEVLDVVTGKLKQKCVAYNILLDSIYDRLCNLALFHSDIWIGTGTGTIDPTRTTLFTSLTHKSSSVVERVMATPTTSVKYLITLNPEDCVGAIITEVGIGSNAAIYTHALLKDSEGNTISITKTATDIINIYATLYITFNLPTGAFLPKLTQYTNMLTNYLVNRSTTSWNNNVFVLGESDLPGNNGLSNSVCGKILGQSGANTWSADVANKQRKSTVARTPVSTGNGHIKEIAYYDMIRFIIPIDGGFAGQPYTGVTVGTGDGVNKVFKLPSRNIDDSTLSVKVNSTPATFTAKKIGSINTQFAQIDAMPNGNCYAAKTSMDNKVVAIAANAGACTFHVYDLVGGMPVARPTFYIGNLYDVALSGDGSIVACALRYGDGYRVYSYSNGVWTKRTTISTYDIYNTVALSQDGSVIALSRSSTPYLEVLVWNGSAYVARPIPTVPTQVNGASISADGNVLAIVSPYTAKLFIWDWDGSQYMARPTPDGLVGGSCVRMTPDGNTIATIGMASPYFSVHDWTGTAWVRRADPTYIIPSAASISNIAISQDGLMLLVACYNTPWLVIYDWIDGAWVARDAPTTALSNGIQGITKANDLVFLASANSPFMYFYDIAKRVTEVTLDSIPETAAAVTADYTVLGIHKTDQYVIDASLTIQFGEAT